MSAFESSVQFPDFYEAFPELKEEVDEESDAYWDAQLQSMARGLELAQKRQEKGGNG